MEPFWLKTAKRIQAIAQSGLAYCRDPFDIERFQELSEISAHMLSHYIDMPVENVKTWFLNETGYQTPKVDVRAVVMKERELLFVKEKSDGKWSLPGGWAEPGLSLRENIIKEVAEESGYEVETERVLAVLDRNRHKHPPSPFYIYKIFVLCRLVGGKPMTSIETEGVAFHSTDSLPELSTERVTREQIQLMLRAVETGEVFHD
ncbi:NUDIX hydrolase [Laceyella putida]|uniref:NUDIX hydrolase n=1 Tax=Laceyella putida TaxID=110101 RepID=A0ABW2RHP8_9BACL